MAFTGYKALDFSGIDKAIQGFQQRQQLASLGQNLDGTPEGYAKAAQALLQKGDVNAATNFFALSEKARERSLTDLATKNSPFAINRPTPTAPSVQGVAPVTSLGATSGAGRASPAGVAVAETPDATANFEAQASGLTQLGNANEPRGLRNNNPGNIESGRFAATVQGFQGSDGRFAQYATPEQGIQAADKLLTSYAGRGLNTVNGIVNRWAPPTENNTGAYVAQVAKELGVDPNQPLDMNNWEVRQKLIAAKIRVENGKQPYAEDVFQRALNPNWGREVAAFEGGAQPNQTAQAGPQFALGNAPPPSDQFTPAQQPTQVAQAPQPAPAPGGDGLYSNTPTPALQAFINNPRVPDNLRALMQQELAKRGGGAPAAPVQLAQAPAQPGAPVSDVPAQGGAEVQGNFTIPGPNQLPPNDPRPDITTPQLLEVLANPRLAQQHPLAKFILDGRQKYSDENAPDKRALTQAQAKKAELEVRKLERELAGEGARPMTPEERAAYSVPEGQPAYMNSRGEPKFGPASTKITNSIGAVEGEYAKANGKAISERFSKIVDEGDAAQQEAGAIARLKELGGSIKNMGAGAALQARLAEYGVKVGENVSEIEAYNALIDKLTPQQRLAGSGATSDFDAKMFKNSLPGLIRTPQGNALIIETMEALNTYKRQRADIVSEAMALNEKPADVVKRLKELPDPFAAFKEARKGATGEGPPKTSQPRAVATPEDYQSLKSGEQYVDPQGNVRTKR